MFVESLILVAIAAVLGTLLALWGVASALDYRRHIDRRYHQTNPLKAGWPSWQPLL
jgi:hypothetical protein